MAQPANIDRQKALNAKRQREWRRRVRECATVLPAAEITDDVVLALANAGYIAEGDAHNSSAIWSAVLAFLKNNLQK
jgi:hypothetical protein